MFSTGRHKKGQMYIIAPSTTATVIPMETYHHLNFIKYHQSRSNIKSKLILSFF